MNLNDLLNVKLYNDNLKMFNQASEETLLALDRDFDEHVLENLCDRQVKTSTLMKNALTSYQQDIFQKKRSREATKDWGLRSITSSSSNSRTCWFLKKSAQESAQQQHTLRKDLNRKAKLVEFGRQKARAQKAENVLLHMTWQRKGTAKELDHEARINETIPKKDITPERQGQVHLEKNIVLRASNTKEEIVVMVESVVIGITRIANTSRKINVRWERAVHSFTRHKSTTYQFSTKRKGEKQKCPKKER